MMRKMLIIAMLGLSFFSGSQIVCTNNAYANVRAGNAVVFEQSIKKTHGHIEVKVLHDNARHPMFYAFRQKGSKWQYGDAVGIEVGQSGWKDVAGSKTANDILYVVLQYI